MIDIISKRRNEVILHSPKMIVLILHFTNYVRRLPHKPLNAFNDWVSMSMEAEDII
jgi:hypothetical protein